MEGIRATSRIVSRLTPIPEDREKSRSQTSRASRFRGKYLRLGKKSKKAGAEDVKSIPYYKLFCYAERLDVFLMIAGFLGSVVAGGGLPMVSLIMGKIMDDIATNAGSSSLNSLVMQSVMWFLILGAVSFAGSFLEMTCWMWTGNRQTNKIREHYLAAVLDQEIGFFDTSTTSGGLLQGLNEDTVAVQTAISEKVGNFIHNMALCIVGLCIAFSRGWELTLVMLALIPVLVFVGAFITFATQELTKRTQTSYAQANSVATQALANVRTVYAFNSEERTVQQYSAHLAPPCKMGVFESLMKGVALGMVQMVMMGGYALAMWYGSIKVADGVYTGGTVLNVLFASLMGGMALGQAAPNVPYFMAGTVAGAKIFGVIKREPKIKLNAPGHTPDEVEGNVELEDVYFAYPARPELDVFKGFSISIQSGTTVALVGESGSGKSTVVGLIERFYDPRKGTVKLDGFDIKTLQLKWYRQQIGLVGQEPTLFATTIFNNILSGNPDASEDEVYAAAKSANAHNFIQQLPLGYKTQVGERGVQLSGGQKQRIAIARAILKNPKVLLLDEATSALDAESERLVQGALDRLMKGRTTIVVAHRLSTIMDADTIAVVNSGRILEIGPPQSLLKDPEGAFSTLVKSQQKAADGQEGVAALTDPDKPLPQKITSFRTSSDASFLDFELESTGNLNDTADKLIGLAAHSYTHVRQAAPALDAVLLPGEVLKPDPREDDEDAHSEESDEEEEKQEKKGFLGKLKQKKAEKGKKTRTEEEGGTPVGFGKLLSLNKPEWMYLVAGVVSSAVAGMVLPVFSIVFASILAVFYLPTPEQIRSEATKWSLMFVVIGVSAGTANLVQQYSFGVVGHRLARRVRVILLRAVLQQEIGWFDRDENNSAAITGRLAVDALAVRGAVGDQLGLVAQNLVVLFGGYTIAFINGWKMTLVILSVIPFMMAAAAFSVKVQMGFSSMADKLFSGANAAAMEAFTSMRTVAAFTMEEDIKLRYRNALEEPTKAATRQSVMAGLGFGVSSFTIFAVYAIGFWYGGREVAAGNMTFEEMNKVFFAIVLGAFGFAQAQQSFPDLAKGKGATQRVFQVINRKPKIDPTKGGDEIVPVTGNIELRDVTFAYPERPEVTVFKSFTLHVESGRVVALVGQSGSGKSTVIGLVERFYDPAAGQVMLDGRDIRDLDLRWYRTQIGLVGQEPVLFAMSIRENVCYGKSDATNEEVEAAVKAANAWDFVGKQPEGLDTMVGEQGLQLSGGQKQRIAIARALLRDPKVLLLDEATSALDAESERVVQTALDVLMKGRTTIVVAHRLSTIRDADTIAVVYHGEIVEQGSHNELVAMNGSYASLIKHQQQAAQST